MVYFLNMSLEDFKSFPLNLTLQSSNLIIFHSPTFPQDKRAQWQKNSIYLIFIKELKL